VRKWRLQVSLDLSSLFLLLPFLLSLSLLNTKPGTDYKIWEEKALTGNYPIPVCTSVFKQHNDDVPFPVVDHTPFEIGSTFLNTYFSHEYYQLENFEHPLPISINNFMVCFNPFHLS
jgi:hypothetical protein